MSKRNIAFIVESAHGHINPTLATTEELVKRGHKVSHAVKAYFAKRVEVSGSEARIYEPLENKLKLFEEMRTGDSQREFEFDFQASHYARFIELLQQEVQNTVDQLEDRYRRNRPDLIIFDRMTLAGRVFARKYSIPTIEYCPSLVIRKFYDEDLDYDDNPVIVTLPRFFQKDADELGSNFHFVGPVLNRGKFFKPWNQAGARNVILVSATTGFLPDVEYFVRASCSFRDLPYRVVLSIGDEIEPASLGPLPENCEINQASSQREILANACLFVSHGGPSSVLEALYCGVPLLLLPPSQAHDLYASRMVELGLGISLQKREISEESLQKTAMMLLNDAAMLERVREVQADLGRSSGASRAADIVEEFLAR